MGDLLERILASSCRALEERKARVPLKALEGRVIRAGRPRDFASALRGPRIQLIAEVKRASPVKGPLAPHLDPAALAREYAAWGAAAISVLTEEEHFLGGLADLSAVRGAVDLPILRKDFITDPYQVYEARAYGADAVLLIATVLERAQLRELLEMARSLGMAALVEVHDEGEVEEALELRAKVVGINNRDLRDFSVDLERTLRLRPLVPPGVVVVSESGISSPQDVKRLWEAGVDAVLVGEALVRSRDPGERLREMLSW